MVICLERGADLHMAQLIPLQHTVSCFSEIQIGFTFLVPAHPGGPRQRAVKRVCVCVRVCVHVGRYVLVPMLRLRRRDAADGRSVRDRSRRKQRLGDLPQRRQVQDRDAAAAHSTRASRQLQQQQQLQLQLQLQLLLHSCCSSLCS